MKIEKWRYLPVEIMTEILTWLPVKSILRFRLKEDIEYLRPVLSLKNGDILLFGQPLIQLTQYDGDLILYNPMSRTAKFVDTSGYQILEAVQTYVGSLVSVNSICNAGQEDVEQPSGYQILNPVLIDV
ncbi:uncharacterized protein LOC113361388 [Papaver somniferum]|uniref:uncharacterized protein LOC113361388 n=1 Tax=Papaver somniferum TaxID=3469 RepID=UPI000E70015E|nr:uncharacterized protein LOC113361388 [Papaver somniferum]